MANQYLLCPIGIVKEEAAYQYNFTIIFKNPKVILFLTEKLCKWVLLWAETRVFAVIWRHSCITQPDTRVLKGTNDKCQVMSLGVSESGNKYL